MASEYDDDEGPAPVKYQFDAVPDQARAAHAH
jgi:hypothetical protein